MLPPEGFKFKLDTVIACVCACVCVCVCSCACVRVLENTQRLKGIETIRDSMEIFLWPRGVLPLPLSTHSSTNTHIYTSTHTAQTHQVFKKRGELLGEDGELEES